MSKPKITQLELDLARKINKGINELMKNSIYDGVCEDSWKEGWYYLMDPLPNLPENKNHRLEFYLNLDDLSKSKAQETSYNYHNNEWRNFKEIEIQEFKPLLEVVLDRIKRSLERLVKRKLEEEKEKRYKSMIEDKISSILDD